MQLNPSTTPAGVTSSGQSAPAPAPQASADAAPAAPYQYPTTSAPFGNATAASTAAPLEMRYQASARSGPRRVHRTIRRVEPWSVLKFSLLFYTSLMLVTVIAIMILFYIARGMGLVGNIEGWIRGVGWPQFRILGASVFRVQLFLGIIGVLFATLVNVFMAFLYNLVSDVIGGVEISMSEREF